MVRLAITKPSKINLVGNAFQFVLENALARKILVTLMRANVKPAELRVIVGNPDDKLFRMALMGLEQRLVIMKRGQATAEGFAVTPHSITELGEEVVELLHRASLGILSSELPEEAKQAAAEAIFPSISK